MHELIRLMVPGPTPLPPAVMRELAQPMIYHREKEFTDILYETVDLLKQLFNSKSSDIVIIPSSGRGAMEAALVNLFSAGDKVLTISNGYFGEIFSQMAAAFGLDAVNAKFAYEEAVDFNVVENYLQKDSTIKAILITHCETSGAVENDLKTGGILAKKYDKLLVVDAVSSLGCMPLNIDENHIDVAVSASQKGLMSPAGLSVASISPKAWKKIAEARLPKYYFDFNSMKKYIVKGQTPVSTPVPLVRALHVSLKLMNTEGFEKVYKRHERIAAYIRDEATKMGYTLYPDNRYVKRANSLSAFSLPAELKAENLVKHVLAKYNTLFAKGLGEAASGVLRIGHMGWVHEEDAVHVTKVLKGAKEDLGF